MGCIVREMGTEKPPQRETRFADIEDDEWFLDGDGDLCVRPNADSDECVYISGSGLVGKITFEDGNVVTPVEVVIEWRKPT